MNYTSSFRACASLGVLLMSACGGGDGTETVDASVARCVAVDDRVLATDARLLDAIVVDGEPVALVATQTGSALLRGGTSTPFSIVATEGALAVDASGVLTAVLRAGGEHRTYVARSPELVPVDTGLDEDLSRPHLVHTSRVCSTGAGCVDVDDLTLFFEGGFSSASAAHLHQGTWVEEELYLSSISWIQDTTQLDGDGIACVRYDRSAILLGHHPYRGDLDDLAGWPASGPGCALAARGREMSMVLGNAPARLARWTVPLMPSAPWPTPPAAVDLPMTIGAGYDLAADETGLVLAYADKDGAVHLATEAAGAWTEQPAPALATSRAPVLLADASARHLLVETSAREIHYARQCR